MRVLSLFSGVGGFDMGLEAAGMITAFQCEIDKHARKVLDHHWPDVPKWDDVSTLTGKYILEHTDGIDVVAWGSPCQDLSVAGKRNGLEGNRSGLFYEGIRIIKELRELSNGKYPTWSIWENVTGALSSNGCADFGQVIYEMENTGAYFSEWAVLDAQYFGVPQRRRRIFLASCFDSATSERCSNPLFPVSESLPGDFKKGRKQEQNTSHQTETSVNENSRSGFEQLLVFTKSRRAQSVDDYETWVEADTSNTLNCFDIGDIRTTTAVLEPVAYSIREDAKANNFSATPLEVANALQALQPSVQSHHAQTFVMQPIIIDRSAFNTGFEFDRDPGIDVSGTTPTVIARGPHAVAQDQEKIEDTEYAVRRLTPLECERLMGWPDGHTAVAGASDSQRYKMCGNGVASPVAKWVGLQILKNA